MKENNEVLKDIFGKDINIFENDYRNERYDYLLYRSSESITVEWKQTDFSIYNLDNYKNNIVLIELLQCQENVVNADNATILNNRTTVSKQHQLIGWGYKCTADFIVWNKTCQHRQRVYLIYWKYFWPWVESQMNLKVFDEGYNLTTTKQLETEKMGNPVNIKINLDNVPEYMFRIYEIA